MASVISCQATVYPDVECSDTEIAYLQPLVFTICFPGAIPRQLIEGEIPVQISVLLSEPYCGVAVPEVRTGAWRLNEHPSTKADSVDDDGAIPFLPLPSFWNYMNSDHWLGLLKEVERWLVRNVPSIAIPQWAWGRDIFWLTFVGAYPSFPHEQWDPWDPNIPMEGPFIEEWLTKDGVDGGTQVILPYIWDEFCKHAALFYPSPLIASS